MFGKFFSKKPSKPDPVNNGVVESPSTSTAPEVQVLHLILEQALNDKATEVLLQYDRFRNDFAVYYQLNGSFEQALAPPATLFNAIQIMLVRVAGLRLPEDEGMFILPRDGGGMYRFSIAIEDEGASMAIVPLGYGSIQGRTP